MDANGVEIVSLFSSQLLTKLDYSNAACSPSSLEFNLVMRPLRSNDFSRGYTRLLEQLTKVGQLSESTFKERFNDMHRSGSYYVVVIEDVTSGRIVATATLFNEFKFIHSAAIRGRIEDVVVDSEYRGQRLGHLLVETLKLLAVKLRCYKITLDCNDDMVKWYNKMGFKAEAGRANVLTLRNLD